MAVWSKVVKSPMNQGDKEEDEEDEQQENEEEDEEDEKGGEGNEEVEEDDDEGVRATCILDFTLGHNMEWDSVEPF